MPLAALKFLHAIESTMQVFSAFLSASQAMITLCGHQSLLSRQRVLTQKLRGSSLKYAVSARGSGTAHVYSAAEAFASAPEGLDALLEAGAIAHLLGCLTGIDGHISAFTTRSAAVSLLSKFLWNPVKGPDASHTLRRFLPGACSEANEEHGRHRFSQVLDDICRTRSLFGLRRCK